jgi:type IV secretory pathway VirB4 component
MIDNVVLGPTITDFLNRMRQKNCVVIFTSEDIEHVANSNFTPEVKKNITTEIFMPNSNPHECYKNIFGLNNEEMDIVRMMEDDERHFLFKHGDDAVIASLNLSNFVELLKIFSADEITLAAMEEVISVSKTDDQPNPAPEAWLPQLFEVLNEIEKERLVEEKERVRKEDAERRRAMKQRLEDGL